MSDFKAKLSEARTKLHVNQGQLNALLEDWGDTLAEREGYKDLEGINAIHFYLVHKFGWMPHQVKAMKFEDIQFVLSQEMAGWTKPRKK